MLGRGFSLGAAFFIAVLISISPLFGGSESEDSVSEWKDYERFDFVVDGRPCYIVAPEDAAAGRPWIWRARFPGFHTGADLLLLERGFHIAFMDTNGMLGSPRALEHWDRFYEEMTSERGFSSKVALEAVSRGGLFAYHWASQHPDRVACIYADTPVCDFKSWPLGQGSGAGNAKTWERLLDEYGFMEEEALSFDGNPIDVLAPIAERGVPLLHIVSLNDHIVPPTENTFVLAARYRDLGGSIEIMMVEQGTEKSSGHHFTHPDPERVADFIELHAGMIVPDFRE